MKKIVLPDEFNENAKKIHTMRIRGAGKIARFAAETIKELAESYDEDDLEELKKLLTEGARALLNTRPTAISLRNALRLTLQGSSGKTVNEFKESVKSEADKFIKNSLKAVETIGIYGSKRIEDSDTLLTHCNSSASLAAILQAHKDGKKIRTFATETRPWNQGYLTAKELAKNGVDVTLIVDSAVRYIIEDEDIKSVFVGADTVCSNGAVINKIGTSQIALAAHEARIPFYVCAEIYKFSPESLRGELVQIEERDVSEIVNPKKFSKVKFRNPVFDATPAEYIDAIITEKGVIAPHAAYDLIEKEFREMSEWSL
ncbi:MAG: ribose 1,5-bisphosphate isomerase [Methanocellales archaeon]|nr:ribose 1,5-bisphosphate isomerase [Methanocellales archaeon]MDD3292034.1 ribose 1,5-bisphosphate isomerase [Methanocellales archaeon]MDD5235683.1 ribose 1,5-bisphosphate isomerase [Methanocellales archaeon]MDD5485609.1 ribose 1,5-bisphosphate isomerase [Methanocellales archaeon]